MVLYFHGIYSFCFCHHWTILYIFCNVQESIVFSFHSAVIMHEVLCGSERYDNRSFLWCDTSVVSSWFTIRYIACIIQFLWALFYYVKSVLYLKFSFVIYRTLKQWVWVFFLLIFLEETVYKEDFVHSVAVWSVRKKWASWKPYCCCFLKEGKNHNISVFICKHYQECDVKSIHYNITHYKHILH